MLLIPAICGRLFLMRMCSLELALRWKPAANRKAARSIEPAAFAGFPVDLIAKAVPAGRSALVVGVRYCKIAIYRGAGMARRRRANAVPRKGSASLAYAGGDQPAADREWLSDWQPN